MEYTTTQDLLLRIRQQMMADNINQTELASRLHMSRSGLSSAFRRKNMSIETLNSICQALGYSLEINIVRNNNGIVEKIG